MFMLDAKVLLLGDLDRKAGRIVNSNHPESTSQSWKRWFMDETKTTESNIFHAKKYISMTWFENIMSRNYFRIDLCKPI